MMVDGIKLGELHICRELHEHAHVYCCRIACIAIALHFYGIRRCISLIVGTVTFVGEANNKFVHAQN